MERDLVYERCGPEERKSGRVTKETFGQENEIGEERKKNEKLIK